MFDEVKDFIVLHFLASIGATRRSGESLVEQIEVPPSLQLKLDFYEANLPTRECFGNFRISRT